MLNALGSLTALKTLIIKTIIASAKAVIASKEDEIKKAQMTFVKRLIAAVIVFFIIYLVQLVVNFIAGSNQDTIMGCFNCFIKGEAKAGACVFNG